MQGTSEMKKMRREMSLKAALALGAAIFVAPPVAAVAQSGGESAADSNSDEIIVSARRRDEAIGDTPLAISAFGKNRSAI